MFDVTMIGCGVIGASIAYKLSQYDLKVLVLERENDVAMGTTKANSAIVHAGYDPEPGTLMAKLNVCEAKDLYIYWGSMISEEIFRDTDCVVNLASKEYSLCLSRHLPEGKRLLTCSFVERKGEKLIEKGTLCKMARGEMVRFMAEQQVEQPEELQRFDGLGYRFSPEDSNETNYTYIKEED